MKINENWSIDSSDEGCTLTFSETRIKNKDTEKEEEFLFKTPYYYPTIKTALVAYLNKSLEKSKDVEDCIKRIEKAEKEIHGKII